MQASRQTVESNPNHRGTAALPGSTGPVDKSCTPGWRRHRYSWTFLELSAKCSLLIIEPVPLQSKRSSICPSSDLIRGTVNGDVPEEIVPSPMFHPYRATVPPPTRSVRAEQVDKERESIARCAKPLMTTIASEHNRKKLSRAAIVPNYGHMFAPHV
jgi:hypothetical protein